MGMDEKRLLRSEMRKVREDEWRAKKRFEKLAAELADNFAFYGIKLSYTVSDPQTVRRKDGYKIHHSTWNYIRCPKCRGARRLYYLYREIKPWHKETEYQCGYCGHEWKEIDNTYD